MSNRKPQQPSLLFRRKIDILKEKGFHQNITGHYVHPSGQYFLTLHEIRIMPIAKIRALQ